MRVEDLALEVWTIGFGIPGQAFCPEAEGVPVDEGDDFEGDEGIF